MTPRTPTLAELLSAFRDGVFRDLRVALPGRVESFDAITGTADVQPMVREAVEGTDGAVSQVSLPVLTGVPIMFPGGGGLRITFPMAQGDFVWLHFGDRSIDAWLDQGSEGSPVDTRRHALSDAVAYPGIRPTNSPWQNVESGVITAGLDSASSSDFVALASPTKSEISKLRDSVDSLTSAYNAMVATWTANNILLKAHVHASLGTPSPALAGMTDGSSASSPDAVGDLKSETFKVRG